MLIGQEFLQEQFIYMLNHGNLPHTMILVGPEGQGKRTFAKWLVEQMEAQLYIPEDLKIDSIRAVIDDSRTISSDKIYLLADCEDMTVQAQNSLLKLAEEPPENAYIVMTVKDTSALLPTIMSRSVQFRLGGYSITELSEFTNSVDLMKIAGNPGTIMKLTDFDYEGMLKHATKVVTNIGAISASNAFNILRSISKEHYDVFISMLIHAYGEKMKSGLPCAKQLAVIYKTKNLLERHKSINKANALEMMFVELREVARDEVQ